MKIIQFSDLHFTSIPSTTSTQVNAIRLALASDSEIEVVVVTGDIFEAGTSHKFKYEKLKEIFSPYPVICCLGNHEFFFRTPEQTLEEYRCHYDSRLGVHYLDVAGHVDIGNYRFVGNVLWYDGSLRAVLNQDLYDFAGRTWLDYSIKEFNYEKEFNKCIEQINANLAEDGKRNILLTHCVPFRDVNAHPPVSEYNAFSGVDDITKHIGYNFEYSFSGHTHKRVLGEFKGCRCVNCGNDMWPSALQYCVVDV